MDPRSATPRGAESFDSFSSREREREAEREREQLQSTAIEAGRVRALEAKMAASQNKYRQSLLRTTALVTAVAAPLPLVTKLSTTLLEVDSLPLRPSAKAEIITAAPETNSLPRKVLSSAEPINLSNTDTEDELDEFDSLPGFIAAATAARPLHEAAPASVDISGDAGDIMDDDELLRSLEEAGGDLASLFSQEGFAARLRATASAWDTENSNWNEQGVGEGFDTSLDGLDSLDHELRGVIP